MKRLGCWLFAISTLISANAFAQDEGMEEGTEGTYGDGTEGGDTGEAATPETAPMDSPAADDGMAAAAPAFGPAKGKLHIWAALEANMSKSAVFKPFSIAPDVSYGVSDVLSITLVHSTYGTTGFRVAGGQGICVTGTDNGCPKVYNNVGLEGTYTLMSGNMNLAVNGGLHVTQISDPMLMSLKLGIKGNKAMGKLLLSFAPNIFIGLTERDFNKEFLNIPVYLGFAVSPELTVQVGSGIAGPLDGFGDAWALPLSVGAGYAVNEKVTAGLDFAFPALTGAENVGSTDFRTLILWAGISL